MVLKNVQVPLVEQYQINSSLCSASALMEEDSHHMRLCVRKTVRPT